MLREETIFVLHAANIICLVGIPSFLVWTMQPTPGIDRVVLLMLSGAGIIVMLTVTCACGKMISFAHVNYNLRQEARKAAKSNTNEWPGNLTLKSICHYY